MNILKTSLKMGYKAALFVPQKRLNTVKSAVHIIVAKPVSCKIGHDIRLSVNVFRNYIKLHYYRITLLLIY